MLVFTLDEKPWTTNAERRQGHWGLRAAKAKHWREAFAWMAAKAIREGTQPFTEFAVTVQPVIAKGRLADADAYHPSAKAAIDGLVDGGLMPDDGPRYMKQVTMRAPLRGPDALRVKVEVWHDNAGRSA